MHNLLELVQKEQSIYNICFHELIRQVSVQCVERGELLANIRRRYSNLLDRIPRQVKRYVSRFVLTLVTLILCVPDNVLYSTTFLEKVTI